MGLCWSTNPPEDGQYSISAQSPKCLAQNIKTAKKVVEFGREEVKLHQLLGSLRTGLVFAPTEFSVLPGSLSTTGKLSFEVGNSELQRRQAAVHLEEESLHNIKEFGGEDGGVEEECPDPNSRQPFKLKLTLEGHGWVKKLVMILCIEPVVGQFAGRSLQFRWRCDTLDILGSEQGELEAHSLPISFESEVEFCTCCLQLTYQTKKKLTVNEGPEHSLMSVSGSSVPSLKFCAYKTTVANLDVLADRLHTIPAKLYCVLFGSHDPVDITITLWPKSNITTFTLKVKSGILFAELIYLIRDHLHFESSRDLSLYSKFRPVHTSEVVSEEFKHLDCFVAAPLSGSHEPPSNDLVLSLVGKTIQSVGANLEMPMEEFDTLIRREFDLKNDSFLIILAENDLAPQYMADDRWKCTYTFSIPNNSFSAGLRRSFRKLSNRSSEANTGTFAPQMAEVIALLSSNGRIFPRNGKQCGLNVEELYQAMPIYCMSIEQCGIHQFSMIQVFEVTGPSIPITVRIISDYNKNDTIPNAHHTRLANIMDINPAWSVSTFLQYIDAVISPSSSSRQRKLCLKDNWVDYKTDLSELTLGALLDSWKPLWWAENGASRRQLTRRDIDPSEYLVVEK